MKKISIISGHQSNYLPYPGYYKKIIMSDAFLIVDGVQFNRKSWQNRNRIVNQGKEQWLTVPTLTKGGFSRNIREIRINNETNWMSKHYRSIRLNYQNSRYYHQIEPLLIEMYCNGRWEFLSDLNHYFLENTLKLLKIDTPVYYDKNYCIPGSKTDLLISICGEFEADAYLSSPNSKAYIKNEKFTDQGLIHYYMVYKSPRYPQSSADFIPDLSIIDMICGCGLEATRGILFSDKFYFIDPARLFPAG